MDSLFGMSMFMMVTVTVKQLGIGGEFVADEIDPTPGTQISTANMSPVDETWKFNLCDLDWKRNYGL